MLARIKSEYFLSYLCKHIKNRDKILKMFNYNKITQKKLRISIEDYKEKYFQSKIIIIPGNPHENIRENVFIRIRRNCYNNYHIYFDNNSNEIKRNYIEPDEKIDKITIYIDYKIKSFKALFLY